MDFRACAQMDKDMSNILQDAGSIKATEHKAAIKNEMRRRQDKKD